MNKLPRLLFVFLAGVSFLFTSCKKDSDNPTDGGHSTLTTTTTIAGTAFDEAGKGIAGITVTAHGQTTTTDADGFFVFRNIRVPMERCFVLTKKTGYFTASRAETPTANGLTQMRMILLSNEAKYTVQSAAGGTVTLQDGGSVQLPANGYRLENGQPYTGTVKVAARRLNPVSDNFFQLFPGDFAAQRADGSQTLLYSYGVLNVELYSDKGAKLQLAPGSKAVLKYPIAPQMQANAPQEMPLWYFDEAIGMWKEEGKAVRQGDEYTGEVSHFTSWNCDIPEQRSTVRGRISCGSKSEPVPGVIVQVGQREIIADENGEYTCFVPAGTAFDISIDPQKNMGIGTPAPIAGGPIAAQQTATVDISLTICPAFITGALVDCNGQPVEGFVQLSSNGGAHYTSTNNGQFRAMVEPDAVIAVKAIAYATGMNITQGVQPIASGTMFDIGNVVVCEENAVTFIDIDSRMSLARIAVSPQGDLVAVTCLGNIKVYDASNGTLVQSLTIPMNANMQTLSFSDDGSVLCAVNYQKGFPGMPGVCAWNTSTWQEIRYFKNIGGTAMAPDGRSIIGLEEDGDAVQYDMATGAEIGRFALQAPQNTYIIRIDGSQFLYFSNSTSSNQLGLWNIPLNTSVTTHTMSVSHPFFLGISAAPYHVAYRANGGIRIMDVVTGAIINQIPVSFLGEYNGLALSPDGRWLVCQAQVSTTNPVAPVMIYDVNTGALSRLLPMPRYINGQCYAYDKNFSVLAVAFEDTTTRIRVWKLK